MPVVLEWGEDCRTHAEAEDVSTCGALLRLQIFSPLPVEFQLHCPSTGQSVSARMVCVAGPASDGLVRLGLELDTQGKMFWGENIPPPDGS